jgi:hypothetical protein
MKINEFVIATAVNADYHATRATRMRERLIVNTDGTVTMRSDDRVRP